MPCSGMQTRLKNISMSSIKVGHCSPARYTSLIPPISIPPILLPVHGAQEGQRKYVKAPCPHCDAVLGHADSLKKHINVVHKGGLFLHWFSFHPLSLPFPLPVRRAHEGQRKYVKPPCPHCNAVLGHADSLKKHINVVHKGGLSLPPYSSTLCFPFSPFQRALAPHPSLCLNSLRLTLYNSIILCR